MVLPQAPLANFVRALVGTAAGGLLAAVAAGLCQERPLKLVLPLLFIVVLIAIAVRFGTAACIGGAVVATLVFAHMLYQPLGSFSVANEVARANLAWMLLGGIVPAYLLVPPRQPGHGKGEDETTDTAAGH